MSAKSGRGVRIIINGFDTSGVFNSMEIDQEAELVDVTVFNSAGREYIPGLPDAKCMFEGFFIGSVLGVNEVQQAFQTNLGASPVNSQLVCIGLEGIDAASDPVLIGKGDEIAYKVMCPVAGAVQINMGLQCSDGLDIASILLTHVARTASATGASVDGGAASTAGLVAHLHCTAASASDTLDVKLQHSTDNSVWADLAGGAFAQLTDEGSSRIEIASGVTVNRYVRAVATIAGTGPSFTFVVAFKRR